MDGVSQTSLGILEDMAKNGDTKEKYQCLESLIDYNQKLLETLNVSHPALENIIKLSKQNGNYYAELCESKYFQFKHAKNRVKFEKLAVFFGVKLFWV